MTKRKRPAYDDLCQFSRTASVDEELLLTLYRQSSWEDRTATLFRLSRLYFAPFFAEHFSREQDARDTSYLHEELEQALRDLCPREHLGELCFSLIEPQLSGLWISAWGEIAPVILGASEQDGQRADELYKAVQGHCAAERLPTIKFERVDALVLIEDWREATLQAMFSVRDD
jgi:hypothetical protein